MTSQYQWQIVISPRARGVHRDRKSIRELIALDYEDDIVESVILYIVIISTSSQEYDVSIQLSTLSSLIGSINESVTLSAKNQQIISNVLYASTYYKDDFRTDIVITVNWSMMMMITDVLIETVSVVFEVDVLNTHVTEVSSMSTSGSKM